MSFVRGQPHFNLAIRAARAFDVTTVRAATAIAIASTHEDASAAAGGLVDVLSSIRHHSPPCLAVALLGCDGRMIPPIGVELIQLDQVI